MDVEVNVRLLNTDCDDDQTCEERRSCRVDCRKSILESFEGVDTGSVCVLLWIAVARRGLGLANAV